MLHKSFRGHADIKSADEGLAEIVVSAYGNVDHDGDIVVKGAAAKQIAGEYGPNPKGFLDHSCSMLTAVAKTLRWWEEDDGLHIEAQYNLEKEIGRDAFSDLKFYGSDMEFSVGYSDQGRRTPHRRAEGCWRSAAHQGMADQRVVARLARRQLQHRPRRREVARAEGADRLV
jgi:hypothetical protein